MQEQLDKEDNIVNIVVQAADDYVTEEERNILAKSFKAADFDGDKVLSQSEIAMAISRETKQHILVRI